MAYLDACQGNKWIGDEGGALMLATARDTEENHFVFLVVFDIGDTYMYLQYVELQAGP